MSCAAFRMRGYVVTQRGFTAQAIVALHDALGAAIEEARRRGLLS